MYFLQNIDWGSHDGVNLSMINDFMRNQFYDRAIRDTVKGRRVMDVGFGTGLLTILSLKHGASSVVAYESDDDRYELGQEVIKRLSLGDRVKLIHDRYDYSMLTEHPDVEVLVTETVNGNIWWEGMFNNIPAEPSSVLFVPGNYYFQIYAVEVPDDYARGLLTNLEGPVQELYPGVDMDLSFVNTINEMIALTNEREFVPQAVVGLTPGLHNIDPKTNTPWGWIPYMRLTHGQTPVAGYELDVATAEITTKHNNQDASKKPFDFRASRHVIDIDTSAWRDKNVLLIPRVGMRSGEHNLVLDTGHWGPAETPVLLVRPDADLTINHSLRSGAIKYQYK